MKLEIYRLEDESKPVCVLQDGTHVLGRGPQLGCQDKRISRNHVLIDVNDKGPTFSLVHHTNPCYWKSASSKCLLLLKPNQPVSISDGDTFGFFPDVLWFKIRCNQEEKNDGNNNIDSKISETHQPHRVDHTVVYAVPTTTSNTNRSVSSSEDIKSSDGGSPASGSSLHSMPTVSGYLNNTKSASGVVDLPTSPECTDIASIDQPSTSNASHADISGNVCDSIVKCVRKSIRDRCWYGDNCYRKNKSHKKDFSHPGDPDYDTDPDDDRPACSYGRKCTRRNKDHRTFCKHSDQAADKMRAASTSRKRSAENNQCDSTDLNVETILPTKRKRREKKKKADNSAEDEYESDFIDDEEEAEEPFSADEDEEFVPSDSDKD